MSAILTAPRNLEHDAAAEAREILAYLGDSSPDIRISGVSGVLEITTSCDPDALVQRARFLMEDEPWKIRYIKRIIPVQRRVRADLRDIAGAAESLASAIGVHETYRITVEKRESGISSREIISEVASRIRNKVSLDSPDRIISIQIVRAYAGVSVLRASQILSVERERRLL